MTPEPSEKGARLVQNVNAGLTPLSKLAEEAERGWGKALPVGWDLWLLPPGLIEAKDAEIARLKERAEELRAENDRIRAIFEVWKRRHTSYLQYQKRKGHRALSREGGK